MRAMIALIWCGLGASAVIGCQSVAPVGALGDDRWRRAPLWDDGAAEFSAYAVVWPRYGHQRPGRALLVVVKEPWSAERGVKADRPGPGDFDVLKLNHQRDVRTGIYEYHQMASGFLHRAEGRLVKFTAMSAEACGLSTARWVPGQLETRSYFDGQGDRTTAVPAGAIPQDVLPLVLREYVDSVRVPERLTVLPSLLAGRFPELVARDLPLARSEPRAHGAYDGERRAVDLRLGEGSAADVYTFDRRPPHVLLEARFGDGTSYVLAKSERLAYWERNAPEDVDWWPTALR